MVFFKLMEPASYDHDCEMNITLSTKRSACALSYARTHILVQYIFDSFIEFFAVLSTWVTYNC